ncbi:MAG: TIGR02921 family PEP-CTERM protein [Synechococcales cyanobacterium RU_4_20]|nr:TIGR02921 family PEP-CTERM protein [Synechococcales cyanobacterium RU_4_20]
MSNFGRKRAIALSLTTLSTWIILLGLLNQQPQARAFALLDQPATTPQAQQALLAQSEPIRQGLLNAYLADYRYVSAVRDNTHIQALYHKTFPVLGSAVPRTLQQIYNSLLSPFLYQNISQNISQNIGQDVGDNNNDAKQAAKRYQQFFDQPIQKTESKAIRRALNATANRDEAKAGLLNVDQHKVLLAQQNITVQEQGDWAEVELHEVYQNQTNDVQEVYYSFSLPESAVLTGVWLGDTGDRSQRFLPQVSPRGAAQKVYNAQVRRVNPIDPALLEQVGPRHYRLRAFPVPAQVPSWATANADVGDDLVGNDPPTDPPTEMHLWLTYQVMQTEQGWPLPQLGEQRNIFWNRKTERQVNGQAPKPALASEQWLPEFIAAQTQRRPVRHTTTLEGYRIETQPLGANDYVLPNQQRFAIVLDASRSMTQHRGELEQTFAWLSQQGFADSRFDNNDADLFITAPTGGGLEGGDRPDRPGQRLDDLHDFDPARFTFWGSLQLQDMLQQFDQLKGDTPYDGILVLTDGDTYELSKDGGTLPSLQAPLWMVHLGKLPPAYDDEVLQAIQQSGGGVDQRSPPFCNARQPKLNSAPTPGFAMAMLGMRHPLRRQTRRPQQRRRVPEPEPVSSRSPLGG